MLLGLQFDDQGIVNSDSRTIAVPHDYANFIPTDIRGTTFARTPAQVSTWCCGCKAVALLKFQSGPARLNSLSDRILPDSMLCPKL